MTVGSTSDAPVPIGVVTWNAARGHETRVLIAVPQTVTLIGHANGSDGGTGSRSAFQIAWRDGPHDRTLVQTGTILRDFVAIADLADQAQQEQCDSAVHRGRGRQADPAGQLWARIDRLARGFGPLRIGTDGRPAAIEDRGANRRGLGGIPDALVAEFDTSEVDAHDRALWDAIDNEPWDEARLLRLRARAAAAHARWEDQMTEQFLTDVPNDNRSMDGYLLAAPEDRPSWFRNRREPVAAWVRLASVVRAVRDEAALRASVGPASAPDAQERFVTLHIKTWAPRFNDALSTPIMDPSSWLVPASSRERAEALWQTRWERVQASSTAQQRAAADALLRDRLGQALEDLMSSAGLVPRVTWPHGGGALTPQVEIAPPRPAAWSAGAPLWSLWPVIVAELVALVSVPRGVKQCEYAGCRKPFIPHPKDRSSFCGSVCRRRHRAEAARDRRGRTDRMTAV